LLPLKSRRNSWPFPQEADLLFCQGQSPAPVEELGCFRRREAKIVGAQLEHPPARAPAGQRQGRVCPGQQDQVTARGQVLDQVDDGFMDGDGFDALVIVQHQQGMGRSGRL
jgi:hypothetical protein